MALTDDDPVWYAAYGSNCSADRLTAYLVGSRAEGAASGERGARDPSPPAARAATWLPAPVRFLGNSTKWGGGVAVLDHPDPARPEPTSPGVAPGCRYLLSKGQFDDLVAQESRRPTMPVPIHELEPRTVRAMGRRPYDGIVLLDWLDGVPVVTFTSPVPRHEQPLSAPSAAYLGTIVRGLVEVHTDPVEMLAAALHAAPGVSDRWEPADIVALAGADGAN